jgi:hypothetical protein
MSALLAPPKLAERLTTEERFRRLAEEWKLESRYLSNTRQMAMLRSYQAIIGMGLPVLPLILKELQREPNFWFHALEALTDEDPVPGEIRGSVARIREAWLDWGRQQGLIA